jgi:hypothetical protein
MTDTTATTTRRSWRRALGKLLKAHFADNARRWPDEYRPVTPAERQLWLKRAWREVGGKLAGLPVGVEPSVPPWREHDPMVVYCHAVQLWVVCAP